MNRNLIGIWYSQVKSEMAKQSGTEESEFRYTQQSAVNGKRLAPARRFALAGGQTMNNQLLPTKFQFIDQDN